MARISVSADNKTIVWVKPPYGKEIAIACSGTEQRCLELRILPKKGWDLAHTIVTFQEAGKQFTRRVLEPYKDIFDQIMSVPDTHRPLITSETPWRAFWGNVSTLFKPSIGP